MNRMLDSRIETVIITPAQETSNKTASLVKEVAIQRGDDSQYVHKAVEEELANIGAKL